MRCLAAQDHTATSDRTLEIRPWFSWLQIHGCLFPTLKNERLNSQFQKAHQKFIPYIIQASKKWNLAIFNDVVGTRGYYAKRNKSVRDNYHMISLICGI